MSESKDIFDNPEDMLNSIKEFLSSRDVSTTPTYTHQYGENHGSSYICPVAVENGFYFALNDIEGDWTVIDDELYPTPERAMEVACQWMNEAAVAGW